MGAAPQTIELDVRHHLRKKLEPFQLIMDTVKTLGLEDTFILHATFKPVPLLGLMKTKGFAHTTEQVAKDHWIVTFVPKSRKGELEEREGDRVVIHNDRVPVFLIEELTALGYPYTIEEQPDGSARVTIQKT